MKNLSLRNIIALILAFSAFAAPAMSQIEAGKSVQITIMGVPADEKGKIDAIYPVSDSGTLNLPFIGKIHASGMSSEALASVIQNAYKSAQIYNNPTIQVISTTIGGAVDQQMVHIGGQVRRTGPVPYTKSLTIYQAIQSAGGASEFGSLKRVKLYRNGRMQSYDITNPQFMQVPLEPNDTLEIPQKNWIGR